MDDLPIWLRIGLAAIPLLAAIIAGVFALLNTVNRRVERLKNLTEVHGKFPDGIAPPHSLELIMLRELRAIDQKTTPKLKWDRRIHTYAFAAFLAGAACVSVSLFTESSILSIVGTIAMLSGSIAIFIFVVLLNAHVGAWRARTGYTAKINELETRAGIRRESD